MTGEHWAGYTFPVGGVSGVRAQWTEPTVTGPSGAEEFVWVGIGGWGTTVQNIIQIGTFAYFPNAHQTNQGIWYENVPGPLAQFPLIDVSPGDGIAASVVQAGSAQDEWRISLDDVTSGQSFTKVLKFDSLDAYPSFVVEDPNSGPPGPAGPFFPFPRWGEVSFSDMQIRISGTWKPAAAFYGYQVQMIRDGRTLATAGPLDMRSGFTAHQQ
ncbi:MAG TPA: G1 family glutamic endopeptidase [Trebonia sp.]